MEGGAPATTVISPCRHTVAPWPHAKTLGAHWGSTEDLARLFGAVAEAAQQEDLRPMPAEALQLVPVFSVAHLLDIVKLSRIKTWRDRLGVQNNCARAQCEVVWLLRDGARLGIPSPRTLPKHQKAQSAALERGIKAYDQIFKCHTAAVSRATGSRRDQLIRSRDGLPQSLAWRAPVTVEMLQSPSALSRAFKEGRFLRRER